MSTQNQSIFNYLKPKDIGIKQEHPLFKETGYRPASSQSSQYSRNLKKKFKNYGEDEDNENWLKQKSTIQNLPKKKRLVFRCSAGGNINDEFTSDNKILHYKRPESKANPDINNRKEIEQSQSAFNQSQYSSMRRTKTNNYFSDVSSTHSKAFRNSHKRDNIHNQFQKQYQSQGTRPQSSYKSSAKNTRYSDCPQQYQQTERNKAGEEDLRYNKSQMINPSSEYNTQQTQQAHQSQSVQQHPLAAAEPYPEDRVETNEDIEENDQYQQQDQYRHTHLRKILQQCIERGDLNMDQEFLDNLTPEEIQSLFTDDLIFNKNMEFKNLVDENPEYFSHLFETSSMKSRLVSGHQTTYGQDFQSKNKIKMQQNPALSAKIHQTKFGGQEQLGKAYRTMYKSDFIQHNYHQASQTAKKPWQPLGDRPNVATTSYGSNFVDWRDYNVTRFKSQKHVSTDPRIPFHGKTNYSENFSKNTKTEGQVAPNDLHKNRKTPFPMLSPLEKETTTMHNYKPYKVQTKKSQSVQKSYKPIPTFSGQFRTTNHRDFQGYENIGQHHSQKKQFIKQILRKLEKLREEKNVKEMEKLQRQIELLERDDRPSQQYIK